MLKFTKRIAIAAGLLAGLASTHAAAADSWSAWDSTHMTGAQCQPSNGTQWSDFLINPDGIRNISSQNRYVSCAIPWLSDNTVDQSDSSNSTPVGRISLGLALDYSQVPAGISRTTNCTLFGRPDPTAPVQSATSSVASVGTSDFQYISFNNSPALNGINPGWFVAQASLNCRLPPMVKLMSIHVYQDDATSNYRWIP